MEIVFVFIAYVWIGLLHGFLVGSAIYAWFGHAINSGNQWKYAFLIFSILLFFESYWILVFRYFGMQVFINNLAIQHFFQIQANTNLVDSLTPSWHTIVSCILQTIFAIFIGNKVIRRK